MGDLNGVTNGNTMEKLKVHSPNFTQDNIARIRALFPGCVTEAADKNGKPRLAVNFDQLPQELSLGLLLTQQPVLRQG